MKKLLSYGGAALINAALLDPIICSGLGKPLHGCATSSWEREAWPASM